MAPVDQGQAGGRRHRGRRSWRALSYTGHRLTGSPSAGQEGVGAPEHRGVRRPHPAGSSRPSDSSVSCTMIPSRVQLGGVVLRECPGGLSGSAQGDVLAGWGTATGSANRPAAMRCTAAERAAPPISTRRRGVTPQASRGATASARPQSIPSTEARTRWPGVALAGSGRAAARSRRAARGCARRRGTATAPGPRCRRPRGRAGRGRRARLPPPSRRAVTRAPGRRSACTPAAGSARSRRRSRPRP